MGRGSRGRVGDISELGRVKENLSGIEGKRMMILRKVREIDVFWRVCRDPSEPVAEGWSLEEAFLNRVQYFEYSSTSRKGGAGSKCCATM